MAMPSIESGASTRGVRLVAFLRHAAALLALVAAGTFAAQDLISHAHGLDETDLVAHAISEVEGPHGAESEASRGEHLDAARDGEHAACLDCLLAALALAVAAGAVALATPPAETSPVRPDVETPTLLRGSDAATPRGPPLA